MEYYQINYLGSQTKKQKLKSLGQDIMRGKGNEVLQKLYEKKTQNFI